MKSVFETYSDLWPESSRQALAPLLSKVLCVKYPEDADSLIYIKRPAHTVIVAQNSDLVSLMKLATQGFEHFVQSDRPDFPQELLASSLMILRPEAFKKNPPPFFFAGFQDRPVEKVLEKNLIVPFASTKEKPEALSKLDAFLSQNARLEGLKDLCIQVADELMTNALFSAPVTSNGHRPNQDLPRSGEAQLTGNQTAELFSCFSDHRVVVGCNDHYGSIQKARLLNHFENIFKISQNAPKAGQAGAGLGFKYMIENSANFYIDVEAGLRTVVACGFVLKGLRANLTSQKHLHFSFG